MEKEICICQISLSTPKEKVFKTSVNDESLIIAINNFKNVLKKENVEIFHQLNNILVTSDGYYCTFYTNDLDEIPTI